MRVYYNDDGSIRYTLISDDYSGTGNNWIEVADQDLGDLMDWRVEAGQLVRAGLAGVRASAVTAINAAADAVRRRYVTTITGQDMLYLRKEAEAKGYIDDPDPVLEHYPLIGAEVGITAPSAWEVAQTYLNMSALWIQAAAQLETARLGAIAAIEVAETVEAIDAIVAMACALVSGAAE